MAHSLKKEEFLERIEADAAEYFDGGRNNNIIDIVLTVSAILTSLIAATVAASDAIKWVRVGVAAVPAACTSVQKVIEVRGRSNWYFDYAAQLRALATTLEHSSEPNLEDFARKRVAIDLSMERAWSQIGRGKAKRLV